MSNCSYSVTQRLMKSWHKTLWRTFWLTVYKYTVALYYGNNTVLVTADTKQKESSTLYEEEDTTVTEPRGDISSWSTLDVKLWLEDNHLEHLETWYEHFVVIIGVGDGGRGAPGGQGLGFGLGLGLKSNILVSVGIASIGIVTRNRITVLSRIPNITRIMDGFRTSPLVAWYMLALQ